jgi:hypothetical protein
MPDDVTVMGLDTNGTSSAKVQKGDVVLSIDGVRHTRKSGDEVKAMWETAFDRAATNGTTVKLDMVRWTNNKGTMGMKKRPKKAAKKPIKASSGTNKTTSKRRAEVRGSSAAAAAETGRPGKARKKTHKVSLGDLAEEEEEEQYDTPSTDGKRKRQRSKKLVGYILRAQKKQRARQVTDQRTTISEQLCTTTTTT